MNNDTKIQNNEDKTLEPKKEVDFTPGPGITSINSPAPSSPPTSDSTPDPKPNIATEPEPLPVPEPAPVLPSEPELKKEIESAPAPKPETKTAPETKKDILKKTTEPFELPKKQNKEKNIPDKPSSDKIATGDPGITIKKQIAEMKLKPAPPKKKSILSSAPIPEPEHQKKSPLASHDSADVSTKEADKPTVVVAMTGRSARVRKIDPEASFALKYQFQLREQLKKADQKRLEKVKKHKEKIMAFARTHNRIDNKDVRAITGLSANQARYYLNYFKKQKKLVQFGKNGPRVFYKPIR